MKLDVVIRFDRLICLTPNESADEPYLWTFFLKLDGETVRQSTTDPDRFEGRVSVISPPGSHGDLGVEDVEGQQRIPIPPERGVYRTELHPIRLSLLGRTVWAPGRVIAFVVLMEEDDSRDGPIEQGHLAVADYFQREINRIIGDLDMSDLIREANVRLVATGGSLDDHVVAIVVERLSALIDQGEGTAGDLVTDQVVSEIVTRDVLLGIYAGLPFLVGFDQDDLVGTANYRTDERTLLGEPIGLERSIVAEIRSRRAEHFEGSYVLMGAAEATPHFVPADFRQVGSVIDHSMVENGRVAFDGGELCIPQGQDYVWKRWEQLEMEDFLFLYPFAQVIWLIEDQPLVLQQGEIRLRKERTFPYFDRQRLSGPAIRREDGDVVVRYEQYRAGQLSGVRLRNRAEDGNYPFRFQADVRVAGVDRRVLDRELSFQGQSVSSALYAEYNQCIGRTFGRAVGKRVGPRDLWPPAERRRWYDEQVQVGDELVRSRLIAPERLQQALGILRAKLRLE